MKTPVKQSHENSLLSSLIIVVKRDLVQGAAAVVRHRLLYTKGVKTDADTAREKHGKPFVVAECRFFVILTEFDVAVLGEQQTQDEDKPHVLRADVQPRKVDCHPRLPIAHFRFRVRAASHGPNDEPPQHNGCQQRCHPVTSQNLRMYALLVSLTRTHVVTRQVNK